MKKYVLFLITAILFSCSNTSKFQASKSDVITEAEAKEILIKHFSESDFYQQYYVTSSPNFDSRVKDLSWGQSLLIKVIPDGKLYTTEKKYYLFTGVMPDGQILVMATVNAVTKEFENAALLNDTNADVLKLANPEQIYNYSSKLGYTPQNLEAIYYFDGTPYTFDQVYCWKYCINTTENRSLTANTDISNFIFIDPWINKNNSDFETPQKDNAYFSKFDINHRAYKLNMQTESERTLKKSSVQYVPID